MPENKHLRFLLSLLYVGLAVLGGWLTATFFFPWFLPLLIALALSAILESPIRFLSDRLDLPRWICALLCTVLLGGLMVSLLVLGVWRLWYESALFLDRLPTLLSAFSPVRNWWEDWLYRFLTAAPVSMQDYLTDLLDGLTLQTAALPAKLSALAVQWAASILTSLPDFFLLLFTTALATYFTAAARPSLTAFFRRQVPPRYRPKVRQGLRRLRATFGQWLRAQGLLMLITFGELAVGFLILGVDYFLLLAALVALVDALPVFGTGTVLLPWSAIVLLGGDWKLAAGLLILYWVVTAVRSLLEPKLVSDRVGLPPLVALLSMYAGFQAIGVVGMIFAPLLAMFLKELHDCGFLHLWRD